MIIVILALTLFVLFRKSSESTNAYHDYPDGELVIKYETQHTNYIPPLTASAQKQWYCIFSVISEI